MPKWGFKIRQAAIQTKPSKLVYSSELNADTNCNPVHVVQGRILANKNNTNFKTLIFANAFDTKHLYLHSN